MMFNRTSASLSTTKFDELNVLKKIKILYQNLQKLNEEAYLEMANEVYADITKKYPIVVEPDKKLRTKGKLNATWLAIILLGYDQVTKYVYNHEIDRKRARLYEAIISQVGKNNRIAKMFTELQGIKPTLAVKRELLTAFNLWWRQTYQYGINVTDYAVIQAYKDCGFKKLRWNTEKDTKVCPICKAKNGKIYDIDNLPPKAHYNCRCYWTPVKENK